MMQDKIISYLSIDDRFRLGIPPKKIVIPDMTIPHLDVEDTSDSWCADFQNVNFSFEMGLYFGETKERCLVMSVRRSGGIFVLMGVLHDITDNRDNIRVIYYVHEGKNGTRWHR